MPVARYQFTVTDERGNIVPNAFVRVRRHTSGMPLATLYSDRAGSTPISNPTQADSEGYVGFHVVGGAYQIEAFEGAFERTWTYVGIGLASESDLQVFNVEGAWDNATTYDEGDLVSHEGAIFMSIDDGNLNNEPTVTGSPPEGVSDAFWLAIPTIQGASGEGDQYDFSVWVEKQPMPDEILARHEFATTVDFAANLVLSRASSRVAATAQTVFSIQKNEVEFATCTFAAAGTLGTYGTSSAQTFNAGDTLEIVAPNPQDATLEDVSFTIHGTR